MCCVVTYDDFVQSVTLTHARVPCVILYNSRQLAELKSFCFHKNHGSVWFLDITYNLGHLYVTVSIYRNAALYRNGTTTAPSFIGPLFIHGNSDFGTFSTFLCHVAARLVGCNFRQLRVGSDGELAIRKAVEFAFAGSAPIACTRHLRENLCQNAHKVTAANDRNVGNLVDAVFGAGGLSTASDTVAYDASLERIQQTFLPVLPSKLRQYFKADVEPQQRSNMNVGGAGWTNNACESVNQHLPELIEKCRALVDAQ